jgi:outer membrane receptor protein involved in Fe transport
MKDYFVNQFEFKVNSLYSFENGVYVEDEMRLGDRFKANAGLRISHFNTKQKHYLNPEPRLMASYMLRDDLSAKASYSVMSQYVHLVSSTGLSLPTDLWLPSTENIKPQKSQQVAAGLAKDIIPLGLNISLEGYYKQATNVLGYREGSSFMLISEPDPNNEFKWEENVTQGKGWSYGGELLIQRKYGKFSGWIGYTLSWTWLQFDEVNNGEKFFAKYDRRNDVSVVGIYRINDHLTLSGTWVYGTGNAITMPMAKYPVMPHFSPEINEDWWNMYMVTSYGGKNQQRMEAYHRADIGLQHKKKHKHFERTLEVSLYNLYNRKNPYFYFLDQQFNPNTGETKNVLKKISIFPIIPSISYNIKF